MLQCNERMIKLKDDIKNMGTIEDAREIKIREGTKKVGE